MSCVVIKGVETREERECVHDLMAKIHFHGYYPGREWINNLADKYPDYQKEHTRLLLVDGEIASALQIFTHTVRLGEARLKMGGFGCVTTAEPFRHKGYSARLMSDSMRFMLSKGYHVSTLFGIADFYHRWGFAFTLPEYASVIDVREACEAPPCSPYKLRQAKPGDIPAMQRLHNQNDGDTACSIIRASAHFSYRWERWKAAQVITNMQGKPTAYFLAAARGAEYCVDEVGAADPDSANAILHACAKLAQAEFASRIRFMAPPSHPFIKQLLQLRSDHEMRVYRNSNGMMAVVNFDETFECLIPEWESLLSRAAAAQTCAEFTLIVDRKSYRIRAHHGAIDVARVAGANKISLSALEFVQLLAGYRHAEEVLSTKRRVLSEQSRLLFETLFIKRSPYVWGMDRF